VVIAVVVTKQTLANQQTIISKTTDAMETVADAQMQGTAVTMIKMTTRILKR
jgi:hypothetical protein